MDCSCSQIRLFSDRFSVSTSHPRCLDNTICTICVNNWMLVACMSNISLSIICSYNCHGLKQIVHDTSPNRSKENVRISMNKGFDLWKRFLNGVEIGRIWRQVLQTNSCSLVSQPEMCVERKIEFHTICVKKLLDTRNMVDSCIVHNQYTKCAWKGRTERNLEKAT